MSRIPAVSTSTRSAALITSTCAAIVALAACGTGGYGTAAPSSAPAAAGAVHANNISGLGTALVDSSGRTLYTSDQEANGAVRCVGSCLGIWSPVITAGTAPPAGSAAGLGVLRRTDDRREQLTYQGKPLYTFRLDRGAGEHRGDNAKDSFGGVNFTWHAAVTRAVAPSSAPSGGGYGGY